MGAADRRLITQIDLLERSPFLPIAISPANDWQTGTRKLENRMRDRRRFS
jgi:hypothetical protein